MAALIGLGYFALDAVLAAVLRRRYPIASFVSFFFLVFCAAFVVLYLLVLGGLPLSLAFGFLCAGKVLFLLWRFPEFREVFQAERGRGTPWILLFLLITTVLVARKGLIFWDDWSNWGLAAKILWFSDGLPDPDHQGAFFDYFLLQSFYWSAFHLGVFPFEEKLGPALMWLIYAVGMLRFVSHRAAYVFVTLLTPFVFPGEYFGTTYTDGLVAVAFALLSVEIFDYFEKPGEGSLLAVVGPLLLLLFAKPVGLYIALVALAAVWTLRILAALFHGKLFPFGFFGDWPTSRLLRLSALVAGLCLFKFFLIKTFLWLIGAEAAQQFTRTPLEAWALGYYHQYFTAVRNLIFVHDRLLFILPALVVASFVFLPALLRPSRALFFLLAALGNFILIVGASLLFFSEQEVARAASFTRYMGHTYLLGYVLLIGAAGTAYACLRERFAFRPGRWQWIVAAGIAWAAVYFFGGFTYYHYKHPLLKNTIKTAKDCAEREGRYQIIAQNDSGLFLHVGRLYFYPRQGAGGWQFCKADTDPEGYPCTATPDREAWVAGLRERKIDHILLVKDDEYLKNELWPGSIPYPEKLPACVDVRSLRNPP